MTSRLFLAISLVLVAAISAGGCQTAGGGLGSGRTNEPEAGGSGGRAVDSETPPPLATHASDVLGPRTDSERVSEDLLAVDARYGEGLTHVFSQQRMGGIGVPVSGVLDLPIFAGIAFGVAQDRKFNWLERGLQLRILQGSRDDAGVFHYRYRDILTGDTLPDGRNAVVSGLEMATGDRLVFFIVDPRRSSVPTGDFSAGLVDLPPATNLEGFTKDNIFVGTLQLLLTFDLSGSPIAPPAIGIPDSLRAPSFKFPPLH